ncbi:MAG: tyrosine-protein phosphatase [Anaerolineaceae bacterium]|nr:tyrosine-protein phosphatase [Anaerolineaceae bacterium]
MEKIIRRIIDIDEFGAALPDITPQELAEKGIELGDTLDIRFSNGAVFEDIPYYNGFYGKTGDILLVAYPTFTYPTVTLCSGDFVRFSGVRIGDEVEFSIHTKGGKKDVMDLRGVVYSNNPEDYPTRDQFANAREFCIGAIAPGKVYRCASPFDRTMNRPDAVAEFLQRHGVKTVFALSETEKTLRERYADMPAYSKQLYESGAVIPLRMNSDYFGEEFKTRLAGGLRILMDRPFPWGIHCMEGKDRTGLVCVLLGAMMDADYDELVDDFMSSFTNYYGITQDSDPFRYEGFKSTFVDNYLRIFAELDEDENPRGYSYRKGAEDYLRSGGMSDAEIERLKRLLRGE